MREATPTQPNPFLPPSPGSPLASACKVTTIQGRQGLAELVYCRHIPHRLLTASLCAYPSTHHTIAEAWVPLPPQVAERYLSS